MDFLITLLATAIPLYCVYQLGSLAGIFSERSGVANVAIEGNMIVGAVLFSILFEVFTMNMGMGTGISIIIGILITIPSSALFMMLLGILTSRYQADHIIAGTGLNILAPLLMLMIYLLVSPNSGGDVRPSKIMLDLSDWILYTYPGGYENSEMNWLFILLLIATIVILMWASFYLNKTKFGLRLKASGENPYSLETAGISVAKTRYKALFIAGMLSSLAGIAFVSKDTFFFTVNGSGFLAIGVLILGQYKIKGTMIGSIVLALFISFFDILPLYLGVGSGLLNKYTNVMKMIPFLIPLIGLMFLKTSYSPKQVGKNFKKDQR